MYSFYYRVRKNERARGGVQQAELYYYIVYKITLDLLTVPALVLDLQILWICTYYGSARLKRADEAFNMEKLMIIERT